MTFSNLSHKTAQYQKDVIFRHSLIAAGSKTSTFSDQDGSFTGRLTNRGSLGVLVEVIDNNDTRRHLMKLVAPSAALLSRALTALYTALTDPKAIPFNDLSFVLNPKKRVVEDIYSQLKIKIKFDDVIWHGQTDIGKAYLLLKLYLRLYKGCRDQNYIKLFNNIFGLNSYDDYGQTVSEELEASINRVTTVS